MPTIMQWTVLLLAKIETQRLYARPYELRYQNKYVLPFIEREYREVYGSQVDLLSPSLRAPRTGTAAIGIDALVQRLTVLGGTSDDAEANRIINEGWEDNDLDVMHREAHRESFIKARSFGSVHRDLAGTKAVVGIESPEQMAVHRQKAVPYDVDASLKVSVDEWTGKRTALLRLPGQDIPLVEGDKVVDDPEGSSAKSRWVTSGDPVKTLLPGVPVAEFAHDPRLLTEPISEIEPIETLVDIVDLIEGLMVFAGHFGAVPIRWATGIDVPRDPSDLTKPLLGPDGKPFLGFNPRADHLWVSTKEGAKFGQLTPAALDSFVAWAEHASSRVRAKTSIASTYYSLDLKSHMSAELLKTDEAPMVRRVLAMGRDGSFNQSWRRIQKYMLMIEAPTSRARVQPRWADPETRVEAQATDSFQKVVSSGIGVRAAAEKYLGWDPEFTATAVAEGQQQRANEIATGDQVTSTLADKLLAMDPSVVPLNAAV